MRGLAKIFVVVLVAVMISPAQSQSPQATATGLESLAGSWQGEGKLLGMPARAEMRWEPVLGGRFTRLSYRAQMQAADGTSRVFEGHGYYRARGEGKFEGAWFDSQGDHLPINAVFASGALTSTWGTHEAKLGRTTYRLVESNRMEVIDEIRGKDGAWQEFGSATLTRRAD